MGVIVEDLPVECSPWLVELRGESFYLSVPWTPPEVEDAVTFPAQLHQMWSRGRLNTSRFRIPAELLPAALVTLADVARRLGHLTGGDVWTVSTYPDGVQVDGPAIPYGRADAPDPTEWGPAQTVEIEYRHLGALRAALEAR